MNTRKGSYRPDGALCFRGSGTPWRDLKDDHRLRNWQPAREFVSLLGTSPHWAAEALALLFVVVVTTIFFIGRVRRCRRGDGAYSLRDFTALVLGPMVAGIITSPKQPSRRLPMACSISTGITRCGSAGRAQPVAFGLAFAACSCRSRGSLGPFARYIRRFRGIG